MDDDKLICTGGIAGMPDPIPIVIDISEEGCKKAFEELVEYFKNAPPPKSIREYMDEIQATWTPDFKAKLEEVVKKMHKDRVVAVCDEPIHAKELLSEAVKKYQPHVQPSGRQRRRDRRKEERKNRKK